MSLAEDNEVHTIRWSLAHALLCYFYSIFCVCVLQNIGVGSYSVCKQCVHKLTGQEYAVKVISAHLPQPKKKAVEKKVISRFKQCKIRFFEDLSGFHIKFLNVADCHVWPFLITIVVAFVCPFPLFICFDSFFSCFFFK